MNEFGFYASFLRFVAEKTERTTADIEPMMQALLQIADEIEKTGGFEVAFDDTRQTGRALAGVAGFLQQHILPEVVAAGNTTGERQVRWVIDTSMSVMAHLTVHSETVTDGSPCEVALPDPPDL